jgi:hypothetical protein
MPSREAMFELLTDGFILRGGDDQFGIAGLPRILRGSALKVSAMTVAISSMSTNFIEGSLTIFLASEKLERNET